MFGGWGFYCDDLVFAIVADETLYLKADGESAARFQAAGGEAFSVTYKDGRSGDHELFGPFPRRRWRVRAR